MELQLDYAKSKPQQPEWLARRLAKQGSITQKSTSEQPEPTLSTVTHPVEAGLPQPITTTGAAAPSKPTSKAILPEFLQGGPKTRKFLPTAAHQLLETYNKSVEENKRLQQTAFPFIHPNFHPEFRLMKGLVVVGALTGQSKSTTNANVIWGFLRDVPTKKAICITNEEPMEGVYNRLGCLAVGVSYGRYQTGLLKPRTMEAVEIAARQFMDRVEVVCAGDWNMTYMEDVKAVCDYASDAINDVGMVTLDYFQTVVSSRLNRIETPYQVFKKLGLYFKEYGTRSAPPIVAFVQIRAGKDVLFKERIEGDRELLNHAFAALEVIPNFKELTTKFIVRKSRYGLPPEGTEIEAEFKDGALVFKDEEEQF